MSYVDLNPIRAGMAKTPEDSDFTSIQERIEAHIQRQRADKAKRRVTKPSTKLYPFVKSKGSTPTNGVDFDEQDYLQLVDWTGRVLRDDKKGAIPDELAPILERVGLNPDGWLKSIRHYNRHYFTALGAMDRIKAYAEAQGKHWLRGQSMAASSYRLVIIQ